MSYPIIISFILLAVFFIIRIPIPLSLISASLVYLIITGDDIGLITDVIMGSLYANSTIVAVPLFVFLANIMTSSKIAEYMFKFVKSLFGKRRGATAYMNILVSLIFAGMSGSAMADICGIGLMEVDEMKKDGYDGPFSCAVSAATAVVGPIFPPSVQMVIFAMLSGASVGKLFMGGVIPAILICVSLGFYVWYISRKRNYPRGQTFILKDFLIYSWKAFPALMTPIILLGGIYSGLVTATESGVLAAVYSILIAILVYKVLSLKDFLKALKNTIVQTSIVMAMLASVYALNLVVVKSGLGETLANSILGITNNKYIFLLMVNLAFVIFGMFLPGQIPTFIIIPLLLPVVSALGIDMVHFGVVVTINLILGLVTPPYGLMCFVISGAAGESLSKVYKEITPMVIIMFIVLFLLVFFPSLVLTVPNLMN